MNEESERAVASDSIPGNRTTDEVLSPEMALLVCGLRRIWRGWKDRSEKAESEPVAAAYRHVMQDLQAEMEKYTEREDLWAALRKDLAVAVRDTLIPSLREERSRDCGRSPGAWS